MTKARSILARLRALKDDRRGAVLMVTAVTVPVLVGFAGIGVEVGMWYNAKRELQTAADAAALSGAFERIRGNPAGLQSAARFEAERNGFVIGSPNTIAVNNPPTSGSKAGEPTAVEVILTQDHPLLLASLFMNQSIAVAARAVAAVDTTGEACVLALSPTASAALNNQGSSIVNMTGCVMASNSTATNAIVVSGSSTVTAFSLWSAGGTAIDGSSNLTIERPPTTNAWGLDDPWAGIEIPPYTCCTLSNLTMNGAKTIGPATPTGVFSIKGRVKLTSSDVLTLKPGTYIIDSGNLELMAGSTLRCECPNPEDGVTIILTSSTSASQIGTFDIAGGANVDLRAPSDGSNPFRGVLFYQDRRASETTSATNKFNGDSSMKLQGAIYIPKQGIEFKGNTAGAQTCTQIVALTVSFTGNSHLDNSGCKDAGVEPVTVTQARLAE